MDEVCIVIKALNEEGKIAKTIQSAIDSMSEIRGRVILADSLSSDNTVNIAKNFGIEIVQLKYGSERSCGIGPQLGFQIVDSEFVYILDGDMELDSKFLLIALQKLKSDPRLGGVAGLVEEMNVDNYTFKNRKLLNRERTVGNCDHLAMGGLYRCSAIREVGYFSNRNLHAFEELDLGLRLSSIGWTLERLPVLAVRHYGHEDDSVQLMMNRWNSGYLKGSGELLRSALWENYFLSVALHLKHLLFVSSVWVASLLIALLSHWGAGLIGLASMLFTMLVVLVLRKRSLSDGLMSFVIWHYGAIGMLNGFIRRQVNPLSIIEYNQLQ